MNRTLLRAEATLLSLCALGLSAQSAQAWQTDWPAYPNLCYSSGGSTCNMSGYTNLTYVSGSTYYGTQYGVAVFAITAAGNIRGGGTVAASSTSSFVNLCYQSSTPASQGRSYSYGGYPSGGKYITGHADDSPNHTGCI
ncbi:MAG TPA: hypothetical protein PKB03_05705 [Baekduia sp.]|nr:hypothetical protein [Baekduia sp.]